MFGERLKSRRKELSMTQLELAGRLGVGKGTVWTWESGERTPSVDTLKQLATELNCSIDWLLGLSDTPNLPTADLRGIKPGFIKQPYNGWCDLTRLKATTITVHDAITEIPDPETFVIPLVFTPGDIDDLVNLPISDWPWEDGSLTIYDCIPASEMELISDTGVVLWWLDVEEIEETVTRNIDVEHLNYKAQFIVMQALEQRLNGAATLKFHSKGE